MMLSFGVPGWARRASIAAAGPVALVAAVAASCSQGGGGGGESSRSGSSAGVGLGSAGSGAGAGGGLSPSPGEVLSGDAGASPSDAPCTGHGWNCKIARCDGASKTTVTAKVYDPAGKVPLYDVVAYVPNGDVGPIADGPSCDTCATPVSGEPIASALTDPSGTFVMQDAPSGINVPLVLQIGRWRRQIVLPEVKPCEDNAFDDPATFRLPRDQSEGHLPKIALAVGGADSLECLLRRVGIADAEFTSPSGPGRVNLFVNDVAGGAGIDTPTSAYASGGVFPPLSSLFASLDAAADGGFTDAGTDPLSGYDLAMLSCQGSASAGRAVTSAEKQGLKTFLDGGGRAFLSHYNYSWVRGGLIVDGKDLQPSAEGPTIDLQTKYTQTPFPPFANWEDPAAATYPPGGDGTYRVDTSFPKGADMAQWLLRVGASTTLGSIDLVNVKTPASSVLPGVAERWIYGDSQGTPYISANTPLEKAKTPDAQCGRVVHTGIHVATVQNDRVAPFPSGCVAAELKPQEKALEFLFFDLSSCVRNESTPPVPPPLPPR